MNEMAECLSSASADQNLDWASVTAVIPAVVAEWSTKSVLVQSFAPGAPLNDVRAVGEQLMATMPAGAADTQVEAGRRALLRAIAKWYGRSLFMDG